MLDFLFYHTPLFYLIQSVWRDEAFSYFMAKPNITTIITNTAHDFNPPLYYILLHLWLNISGKSDVGIRMLSLLPHLATTYIAYLFAAKIFSKRFAPFVAAFTFFNPMLLYYAFEIRMYSLYVLFTLASLFFFYCKNWKWYIVSTVLDLYTHSFFPLVVASLTAVLWFEKKLNRKTLLVTLSPLIFFLPWMPVLLLQFLQSKNSWIFPVDLQLIKSVLGNLFTNYEGTPGGLWQYTFFLSMLIAIFAFLPVRAKKPHHFLFIVPLFLPLVIVLAFSVIRQPVYVNRYMIFATVFEIFAISFGIWSIKNKTLRWLTALCWLLLSIGINFYAPDFHRKTDFESTFEEINQLVKNEDVVYSKTPIGFFESAYYFKDTNRVFIFNPENTAIPNYIGITAVFSQVSKYDFPAPPTRTFLVADDASYEIIMRK